MDYQVMAWVVLILTDGIDKEIVNCGSRFYWRGSIEKGTFLAGIKTFLYFSFYGWL